MEKFDRLSLFPVYIDLPLRQAAMKVMRDQKAGERVDRKLKSAFSTAHRKPQPYAFLDDDWERLSLSSVSRNDRFKRKYCSIKLNDKTLVSGDSQADHTDNEPSSNSVDYLNQARESLEALGADDLKAILATVLELMHK